MQLITKEITDATPLLYETEEIPTEEKVITAKFFAGAFTWYMVEYDPEQKLAFGYTQNHSDESFSEWGYFSIGEFEMYNKNNNFPFIERDLHFDPVKFKELKNVQAW